MHSKGLFNWNVRQVPCWWALNNSCDGIQQLPWVFNSIYVSSPTRRVRQLSQRKPYFDGTVRRPSDVHSSITALLVVWIVKLLNYSKWHHSSNKRYDWKAWVLPASCYDELAWRNETHLIRQSSIGTFIHRHSLPVHCNFSSAHLQSFDDFCVN